MGLYIILYDYIILLSTVIILSIHIVWKKYVYNHLQIVVDLYTGV